jgi:ankyrin repeat protein
MLWTPPNSEYPPPKTGEPPLHTAARIGDLESIRRLAEQGCDINEWFDLQLDPGARQHYATPLMVAAGSGFGATAATIELLLKLGADARLVSPAGSVAYFAASGLGWNYPPGGDFERLKIALDLGCDSNEKDGRDVCILAVAAGTGDLRRVRLLLERGANPNPDWDKAHALTRFEEMKRSFGPDIETVVGLPSGPFGFQVPLYAAICADSIECVRLLLDAGADLHQRDDQKRTPIFWARSVEVARLLVERRANIEARGPFDWTPLHAAVGESIHHVRALLAAGANPNATCDQGYTIFMAASGSSERSVETLKALVDAGANPFAVSELGYNALHAAVDVNGGQANSEANVRDIFRYLVSLGIDTNQRNTRGQTPLELARTDGTPTVVAALEALIDEYKSSS